MEDFVRVNVRGTRNVLDAAGPRRTVVIASVAGWGYEFRRDLDEDAPPRPCGLPYVDTKGATETLALRRGATVIRPGDVYGPGSTPWVVRPLEMIRAGRFYLPSPGDGVMTLVYIDDLVDAIVRALREPRAAGRAYTVWDGEPVPAREYFERLGGRPRQDAARAGASRRGASDGRGPGGCDVRHTARGLSERARTRRARLAAVDDARRRAWRARANGRARPASLIGSGHGDRHPRAPRRRAADHAQPAGRAERLEQAAGSRPAGRGPGGGRRRRRPRRGDHRRGPRLLLGRRPADRLRPHARGPSRRGDRPARGLPPDHHRPARAAQAGAGAGQRAGGGDRLLAGAGLRPDRGVASRPTSCSPS